MKNKILVITATLGNRPSLRRTVDTVSEIGGDNVRHVIVAPANRVEQIRADYGLECIAEDPNRRGIYGALNLGFETYAHDHEYMTFINDDDFWLEDFRFLIDYVKKNDVDFVYGKCKMYNVQEQIIKLQTCSNQFRRFVELINGRVVLLTQQATLLRTSFYFELGGFNEKYRLVADSAFWGLLSKKKDLKYKYIRKYCAGYTFQVGQLSSDCVTQCRETREMLKDLAKVSSLQVFFQKFIFRIVNLHIYFANIFRYNIHVLK